MQHDQLVFIGYVKSSLTSLPDCPLQEDESAPEAELVVEEMYRTGMKTLDVGERLVVLTWLNKGDRSVLECVSRNNYNTPKIGVFSTRSPDRPNPIGLHEVIVLSISENRVKVSGLEVLDQTPILDIKPWLPSY